MAGGLLVGLVPPKRWCKTAWRRALSLFLLWPLYQYKTVAVLFWRMPIETTQKEKQESIITGSHIFGVILINWATLPKWNVGIFHFHEWIPNSSIISGAPQMLLLLLLPCPSVFPASSTLSDIRWRTEFGRNKASPSNLPLHATVVSSGLLFLWCWLTVLLWKSKMLHAFEFPQLRYYGCSTVLAASRPVSPHFPRAFQPAGTGTVTSCWCWFQEGEVREGPMLLGIMKLFKNKSCNWLLKKKTKTL